jgi:hypothetical protein
MAQQSHPLVFDSQKNILRICAFSEIAASPLPAVPGIGLGTALP